MSDGGPLLGSGGWYQQASSNYGPSSSYGPWPTCGCSSLLIIIAGILLVCAGGMSMFSGFNH
jgi:hypothetical protein